MPASTSLYASWVPGTPRGSDADSSRPVSSTQGAHESAGAPSGPDAALGWWTTLEVAEHCGISRESVRAYVSRGILPPPDAKVGRTPTWRPETIITAHASRRGRGWRAHTGTD
jgi:hypothetical protein